MNTYIFLICAISTWVSPFVPAGGGQSALASDCGEPRRGGKKARIRGGRFVFFLGVLFEHPWENDGNYGNMWDFPWKVVYFS